jgi:hypothetical protein
MDDTNTFRQLLHKVIAMQKVGPPAIEIHFLTHIHTPLITLQCSSLKTSMIKTPPTVHLPDEQHFSQHSLQ